MMISLRFFSKEISRSNLVLVRRASSWEAYLPESMNLSLMIKYSKLLLSIKQAKNKVEDISLTYKSFLVLLKVISLQRIKFKKILYLLKIKSLETRL